MITCKYVGIADPKGIVKLASDKNPDTPAVFYSEANPKLATCYFEINLSESQVDIIRGLSDTGDSKAVMTACLQFGKHGGISVPEDHKEVWDIMTERMRRQATLLRT